MTPQLIIAPSIHHARQVERDYANPLSQSLTLSRFVDMIYERHGTKRPIDQQEAKHILASILPRVCLRYFDYLSPSGEAIETIVSFFIDIKRNAVNICDFGYVKQKEDELNELFALYNEFLEQHNLADLGDIESETLRLINDDPDIVKSYGEIIIHDFIDCPIHLESSLLQAQIQKYADIFGGKNHTLQFSITNNARIFTPQPQPFEQVDEVSAALKIARILLERGEDVESIVIVTPAIDEYAPIFDAMFPDFGLNGYSTKGIPLRHFLPKIKRIDKYETDTVLIEAVNAYRRLRGTSRRLKERLEAIGIDANFDDLLEAAIDRTSITSNTRTGVRLTELNQLLAVDFIKHVIFVGTDMDHFPPKVKESFLVTSQQKEKLLYGNNVFLTSSMHYAKLKSIAENLYVVTASYKGKTPITRSTMIKDVCEPFDISVCQSAREWLRHEKRVENSSIAHYLDALQSEEYTDFDGLNVGSIAVEALSASRLTSYAMCPRRYFFDYVLRLKPVQQDEEGFDAMAKGKIMHRCYELFAIMAKNGEITIGSNNTDEMRQAMIQIAKNAYTEYLEGEGLSENVLHRLYLQELLGGLDRSTDDPGGVLKNFLIYVSEHRETLVHFSVSEFEMSFALDDTFAPTEEKSKHFIRGVIDRIDIHDEQIKIVDYKSKNTDKIDKKKIEQMQTFKDMQLPLYMLYARRHYQRHVESVLHTYASGKKVHVEYAKASTIDPDEDILFYDDAYEAKLIERIGQIKAAIEAGDFVYDDSDAEYCRWCGYKTMCLRKETQSEDEQ